MSNLNTKKKFTKRKFKWLRNMVAELGHIIIDNFCYDEYFGNTKSRYGIEIDCYGTKCCIEKCDICNLYGSVSS